MEPNRGSGVSTKFPENGDFGMLVLDPSGCGIYRKTRLLQAAHGKAPLHLWFGSSEWRMRMSKLVAALGLPQAASNIEWRKSLKMPGCYLWDL